MCFSKDSVCFVGATGLAVVGEALLEAFAGEEDAAFDCSEGKVHLFGDFVVFVTLYVHCEGDAEVVGEFVDGVGNFVCSESAFGSFEAAVLAQIKEVKVFGSVDNCGGAGCAAIVVDEDVAHNCEHPAFEVCVFGVFVLIVESFEGSVLKEVHCVVAVGSEHEREIHHVALKIHQVLLEGVCRGCHCFEVLKVMSK